MEDQIKKVMESGNWMIRADRAGVSYGGFEWAPLGEWTTAPDWNADHSCSGGGLFGQIPGHSGMITGERVVFVEYDPSDVVKMRRKIKVRRARILKVGLPEGLVFNGDLSLGECDLSGVKIPAGIRDLDLGGCDLADVTIPTGVRDLNLWGCKNIAGVKIPSGIQYLDLGVCDLADVTIPTGVLDLNLWGCKNIAGVKIPDGVRDLTLIGCDLSGVKIPSGVRDLNLWRCKNIAGVKIPLGVRRVLR